MNFIVNYTSGLICSMPIKSVLIAFVIGLIIGKISKHNQSLSPEEKYARICHGGRGH